MKPTYIKGGNLCEPQVKINANNFILHCCNDIPAMGSGVAKALFDKWPQVREQYMLWNEMTLGGYHTEEELGVENHAEKYQYHFPDPETRLFALGNVQFIAVDNGCMVGNVIGQKDICPNAVGVPPVRYVAIDHAFGLIAKAAEESEVVTVIHLPYLMGCDLAGGRWNIIEQIIIDNFCKNGIECLVYDLFEKYNYA